jgi:hypothetical protein
MEKRRDPKGLRKADIQRMHAMLQGHGDISLKRFLATCSYSMGLTRKTAMSYIQDLVDLDLVEVDETIDLIREVVKK